MNPDHPNALPLLLQTLNISDLPQDTQALIADMDNVLPQTQCGLCGHMDGCLPYAYGVAVDDEPYNLCVPGGQAVTDTLFDILKNHGRITDNTPLTATKSKWQTNPVTKRPQEMRAVIIEDDCIGCTKCIPACPVDAIIGTAKHMHTIISDLCTGCELCLPPCPVDCITLVPHHATPTDTQRQSQQKHLRSRYHQHLNRVANSIKQGTKPVVSSVESALSNVISQETTAPIDKTHAKNTIELAKIRSQLKKLSKQLAKNDSEALRLEIDRLNAKLTDLQNS
jgi:electron transport complex protein RnfB